MRTTYSACEDCYQFAAYGVENLSELSEERLAEVERAVEGLPGFKIHGRQTDDFSWYRCEVCGSKLGGARFEVLSVKEQP